MRIRRYEVVPTLQLKPMSRVVEEPDAATLQFFSKFYDSKLHRAQLGVGHQSDGKAQLFELRRNRFGIVDGVTERRAGIVGIADHERKPRRLLCILRNSFRSLSNLSQSRRGGSKQSQRQRNEQAQRDEGAAKIPVHGERSLLSTAVAGERKRRPENRVGGLGVVQQSNLGLLQSAGLAERWLLGNRCAN